jgi:diaminopimelate epimerase
MKIQFEKYQACGNDFVIIDEKVNPGLSDGKRMRLSEILLDRHFSIGGDSLLCVRTEGDSIRYRVFEAGMEIDMCGNGLRCVADYYLSRSRRNFLKIVSKDGTIRKVTRENSLYRVAMGPFQPINKFIGLEMASRDIVRADLLCSDSRRQKALKNLGLQIKRSYFVNSGEPHLVFWVRDVEPVDLAGAGEEIRGWKEVLPAGANVDIVQPLGRDSVKIRTYERGAYHETLCCGTGSVASAFVSRKAFRLESDRIRVVCQGGEILIEFDGPDVFMTGPAEKVFSGMIDIRLC